MIQFGGVKLKVEPPSKFTGGTKDNYEDFEKAKDLLKPYRHEVSSITKMGCAADDAHNK